MKGTWFRIATGGAVVAVMATVLAAPASAAVTPARAPFVSVANPTAGDYFRRGANWVSGVACDLDASMSDTSAGIARVAVYLGDRDTVEGAPSWRPGGYLGSAAASSVNLSFADTSAENSRLGLANPDLSTCKSPAAGWRVLPSSFKKGTWTMNIYVTAKNGMETKVTIPGLRVDKP